MQKIGSYIPLAITIAGGFIISILALLKLMSLPAGSAKVLACLIVLVYFLWKLLESKITVAETSMGANNDRGTVELCAVVEIGLLVAVFNCSTRVWFPAALVGLVLMGAGLLMRFTAIAALGSGYSLRIRDIKNHIVDTGPYGFVRHPSYLGTLIVHTGLVFVFPGVLPLLFLLLWYVAVFIRAVTEDRFLKKNKAYEAYSKQITPMIFPGIY